MKELYSKKDILSIIQKTREEINEKELKFPCDTNIGIEYLRNKYSNFTSSVETDSITNNTLSFKEIRAIQKEIKQIYNDLKSEGLSFKAKRTLQKQLKDNYFKLKVDKPEIIEPTTHDKLLELLNSNDVKEISNQLKKISLSATSEDLDAVNKNLVTKIKASTNALEKLKLVKEFKALKPLQQAKLIRADKDIILEKKPKIDIIKETK